MRAVVIHAPKDLTIDGFADAAPAVLSTGRITNIGAQLT
jgi:hypothetical protein